MRKSISAYCRKGFTLIELIVVLGIVAVLGTATLTTARGIQRRTLNNASLALQADLRMAQRMALIEGRRWRTTFDMENNRYFIHPVPRDLAGYIHIVYLPNGVTIDYFTHANLEYLPRGTVSSGFRIDLRNGPYIQRLTATVSAGRIAVFDIERLA